MNVSKKLRHKPYRLEGGWWVTAAEVIELLDYYTLDEIQVLIQENTFSKELYKAIRPYLLHRVRMDYTSARYQNKFYFSANKTPDGKQRKGRRNSA